MRVEFGMTATSFDTLNLDDDVQPGTTWRVSYSRTDSYCEIIQADNADAALTELKNRVDDGKVRPIRTKQRSHMIDFHDLLDE